MGGYAPGMAVGNNYNARRFAAVLVKATGVEPDDFDAEPIVWHGGSVSLQDAADGFVANVAGEEWDATGDRQSARRMMLLAATAAATIARGG